MKAEVVREVFERYINDGGESGEAGDRRLRSGEGHSTLGIPERRRLPPV